MSCVDGGSLKLQPIREAIAAQSLRVTKSIIQSHSVSFEIKRNIQHSISFPTVGKVD
jgi:hypothetical protein